MSKFVKIKEEYAFQLPIQLHYGEVVATNINMEELTGSRIKKKVYAVQYKHGYPFFTFYEDGKWVTRSAKYYVPVEGE